MTHFAEDSDITLSTFDDQNVVNGKNGIHFSMTCCQLIHSFVDIIGNSEYIDNSKATDEYEARKPKGQRRRRQVSVVHQLLSELSFTHKTSL